MQSALILPLGVLTFVVIVPHTCLSICFCVLVKISGSISDGFLNVAVLLVSQIFFMVVPLTSNPLVELSQP